MTADETEAILEEMAFRNKTGEEVRAALAKHFTLEKLNELVSQMPEDAQDLIRKKFSPRPTVRRFKFSEPLKKKP